MSDPKVSFIIPIYNVEQYLEACIKSVVSQSMPDIEVLLVDDGSTDSSGNICDIFAGKDRRVRVVHKENGGVSTARNTGISMARGEWICFVDGDDTVGSRYAEYIERLAEDNDVLVFLWENQKELKTVDEPEAYNLLPEEIQMFQCATLNKYLKQKNISYLQLGSTSVWAKAYRKKFITVNSLRFPEGIVSGEDAFFNLNVFGMAEKVRAVYAPIYYYRHNQGSVTQRYNPKLKDNFSKVLKMIEQYIAEHEDAELRKAQNLYSVSTFMFIALQDFCHPNNPTPFQERKKQFLALRASQSYSQAFRQAKLREFSLPKACVCQLCRTRQFELLCLLDYLREMRAKRK